MLVRSWSAISWGTTSLESTTLGLLVMTRSNSVEDVCVILVGLLTNCVNLLLFMSFVILLSLASKLSLKSPSTNNALSFKQSVLRIFCT